MIMHNGLLKESKDYSDIQKEKRAAGNLIIKEYLLTNLKEMTEALNRHCKIINVITGVGRDHQELKNIG